jgi:hypothetical protein
MASFATREFGVNCGRGVGRAHGASAAGRGDSKEMERSTTGGCGVICVAVVTFWGVFFDRRRFEGDSGERSERATGGGGGGGRSRPRDARRRGDFFALFRVAGGGDGGGRSRSRPSD